MATNPYSSLFQNIYDMTPGDYVSYIQSNNVPQGNTPQQGYNKNRQSVISTPPEEVARQATGGLRSQSSSIDPWVTNPAPLSTGGSSIDPWMNGQNSVQALSAPSARQTAQQAQQRNAAVGGSLGGSLGGAVASQVQNQIAGNTPVNPTAHDKEQNLGSGQANTAFGQLFKPEAYNDAWGDPEALINTYLDHVGAQKGTGGAAQTQQLGDSMGLLYLLMNNGMAASDLDTAGYLDWSGQYLDQMRTPGGASPNFSDMMQTLLNPQENSVMANNLYANDMTSSEQVNALLSSMQYAGKGTMPSLVLKSMLTSAANAGEDFRANQLTGQNDGNFGQYLQERGIF